MTTDRESFPTTSRPDTRERVRAGAFWVSLALVAGLAAYLWPVAWGGGTSVVVVSGHSMEQTYADGDVVVARAGTVAVGDVVVYRPDGVDGLVVHRVVGGDAVHGWVLRGDNNDWDDLWRPTADQVVGVVAWHLPGVGRVTGLLSSPAAWLALVAVAAGVLLWPTRTSDDEPTSTDDEPMSASDGDEDADTARPELLHASRH